MGAEAPRKPSIASLPWALLLVIMLGLACAGETLAQSSPFRVPTPDASQATRAPAAPQSGTPSIWSRFWLWVQTTQRRLHRQLAAAVRGLKTDGSIGAGWLLASLSFLYGVVHAVGPGHGKAVISSYVIANERTVRRGISLSFLAAGVQALSAIAIVGVLAVLLNAAGLRIKEMAAWLETGSYALIALVGAWLLMGQLRRGSVPAGAARAHDHDHGQDGDGCCDHAHMLDPAALEGAWDARKSAAIVMAVGLRPCTGALVVLVFALAQGLFLAGVWATFAMALGTAITISVLAALAVGSKELALRYAHGDARWTGWITRAAGLGGSALVLALGATLFVGSLGPARPF